MQVGSICSYSCQNSVVKRSENKPSFTSILPYKVIMEGRECVDIKNVERGLRQLRKIISKLPENEKERTIINTFAKNMPEFSPELVKNGTYKSEPGTFFPMTTQNRRDRVGFDCYMAIGKEADDIKTNGYLIGLNKLKSKERLGNSNEGYEVGASQKGFGYIFNRLINNFKLRTKNKYDEPMTLYINMANNGKFGKTTFKSWIEGIEFRPPYEKMKPMQPGSVREPKQLSFDF